MFTTPILLITFNRPDHVRQVLTEIRKQQPAQLFVCQDGARETNQLDTERVQEVREVVNELVDWPCELHTLYQERNLGCGSGPAVGITWFFEHVEMGIILEDDAVPHPDFFEYASTLLEKYKNDDSVRAIGSMKLYDEKFGDGSYYFSMMNRTLCAWASWRRAWKYFDYEMKQYTAKDLNRAMKQYGATLREREYWQERLEEIHKDCLGGSSWDQQFWMTIWLTGGKGICPNSNLSTNIGFDEMGTHTTDGDNVGSCRPLEPILPITGPTNESIQRQADLLFHKTYYAPWEYGWSGVKRIPHRLNTRIKRFLGYKGSWKKIFLLKLIVIWMCVCGNAQAMNVVFRMDDPTLLTDSVATRILRLFNEKQVPLTIAMIPCDSSEVSFEVTDSIYFSMLKSSNVEIALHGLNHANINGGGEFGCIDSIETERRIRLGKKILESQFGKDIVTFIPPYNTINRFVPKVMLNNGMYILSSDMYDYSYDNQIQYFPETLNKDLDRKGFVTAAKEAIDNAFDMEVCVLMFHVYDFDDEVTWQRLTDILDYCIAHPNIELHTFRSLYENGERSSYNRYRANQMKSGLQKYFLHKGVLHTTRLCWFVHILNALLYALIPLLLLIGIGKMRSYYRNTIYAIVAFGCVAFFIFAFFNVLGPLKLLGVDILFVLCTLILTHSIYRICIKK